MPNDIGPNKDKQPEPEIWLGPGLGEQSIYVINPVFSLILEHYL